MRESKGFLLWPLLGGGLVLAVLATWQPGAPPLVPEPIAEAQTLPLEWPAAAVPTAPVALPAAEPQPAPEPVEVAAESLSEAEVWQARWREGLRAGVRRTAWVKTAVQELTAAYGRWLTEEELQRLGLTDAGPLASNWLAGAQIIQPWVWSIEFTALAGGGSMQYRWHQAVGGWPGWWECTSANRSDIELIFPECRYSGSGVLQTVAAPAALENTAHANEIGTALDQAFAEISSLLESRRRMTGNWPKPTEYAAAGLRAPVAYRDHWLQAVEYATGGQIAAELSQAAGGGSIIWQPVFVTPDIFWWHCSSANRNDVAILVPGCSRAGTESADEVVRMAPTDFKAGKDPRDIHAFRAALREDIQVHLPALVQLHERYLSMQDWPGHDQFFGNTKMTPSRFVESVQLSDLTDRSDPKAGLDLRLVMRLKASVGAHTISWQLMPSAIPGQSGWWRCVADRPDIALILGDCSYQGSLPEVRADPRLPDLLWLRENQRQLGLQVNAALQNVQVTVTEYAAGSGGGPIEDLAATIRVAKPAAFANPWIEQLDLHDDLTIRIVLSPAAGAGSVVFTPMWAAGQISHWTCHSADRKDVGQVIPACEFRP